MRGPRPGTTAVVTSWRMAPRLLLRRAGFEIRWWRDLAHPTTSDRAGAYRARVADLEAARAALLPRLIDAVAVAAEAGDRSTLKTLSRARRALGRRGELGELSLPGPDDLPAVYRTAWTACQESRERLERTLAEEPTDRDRRLRPLLGDPRFRDAILQLAPAFHGELMRWSKSEPTVPPRSRDRAFQRRVYLYAQRLAGKNETTSFFGPLVHGRVCDDLSGIRLGPQTRTGVHEVEAFAAFWAVCALADAIAADEEMCDLVPPAWMPACRRVGGTVTLADGRTVRLGTGQATLVDAVDGTLTVSELARAAGMDVVTARTALDRLARAGAVRRTPEPPSTSSRPLDWLIGWTERHAGHTGWPADLAALRAAVRHYGEAPDDLSRADRLAELEECFVALTGVDSRRAGGRMYADRAVVSIDAQGDHSPVLVGADVAARWSAELAPVLGVAAWHGELRRAAAVRLCTELMKGARELPYDELIRRVRAVPPDRLWALEEPARLFADRYRALVLTAQVGPGTDVELDPGSLVELHGSSERPWFVSPDLMVEHRPDGNELLVLGELHPYVFAWGSQRHFCPDPAGLAADFAADLEPWGGPDRLATVIRRRQHKGLVSDAFPGKFIEVTAVATDRRERAVALSDVVVIRTDDGLALRAGDGELVLYAGEDDHAHLRAFAASSASLPPVWVADTAPRVRVGNLIAQRARWRCAATELGISAAAGAVEVFLAVQRLRVRRGLPRFCFAGMSHEPKPVGIDLDNPLAVEALTGMLRTGSADHVLLSEMRPGPDALWLRHHGEPTTSEFRLAFTGGAR